MLLHETFDNQLCFIGIDIFFHVSFLFKNPFIPYSFSLPGESIRDHTRFWFMEFILNFMALSHLLEFGLNIALSVGHRLVIMDDEYAILLSHKKIESFKLLEYLTRPI